MSPEDIANRALDEIAADSTISSFSQPTKESELCARWYDPCRRMLLRAAPWGFARRQLELTVLGSSVDDTSIQPWLYKYLYPADCLKARYLIPSSLSSVGSFPLTGDAWVTGMGSYRGSPFIIGNEIVGAATRKLLLSNLQNAIAVYVVDEETVDLFDAQFVEALVATLGAKLAMPMTASKEMVKLKIAQAERIIDSARVSDAGEARPTIPEHTPDWLIARGLSSCAVQAWGPNCYYGWDDMSWGM